MYSPVSKDHTGDVQRAAALKAKFQISSIPSLVILNRDGELVTKEGRAAVVKSGPKAFDQW
jgi:hypothetical protein